MGDAFFLHGGGSRELVRFAKTHWASISTGTILSPSYSLYRRVHSLLADRILLRKHEQNPEGCTDFISELLFNIFSFQPQIVTFPWLKSEMVRVWIPPVVPWIFILLRRHHPAFILMA